MFPKNSAFSKSEEAEAYEQGVRERALSSAQGQNELADLVREAKQLVSELSHLQESRGEANDNKVPRDRPSRSSRPSRPY